MKKNTVIFFQENKETLLTLPNSCLITNNDPQIENDQIKVQKSEVTSEQ